MKKLLFCLALLASLASLCIAQDTAKPVDYVARALPLDQVLLDLENKSGVRLDCDPAMENEPLILKLNHVPLQEALDKIALVFAADWVKHDNVLRLERSPAKLAKLQDELLQKRAAAIKESIDSLMKLVNDHPPLDEPAGEKIIQEYVQASEANRAARTTAGSTRLFEIGSRMPTMRLAIQILSEMDPVQLARTIGTHRYVFSTRPNAMQFPLPEINPAWIQQWNDSRKALQVAYDKASKTLNDRSLDADPTLSDRSAEGEPLTKVLMSTYTAGKPFPLAVEFNFYNEKGVSLASDSESLGTFYRQNLLLRDQYNAARQKALKDGFTLGPVGQELAPRIGTPSQNLRPLSPSVIEALSKPTRQDPLSFATADIVLNSAEAAGTNAICLIEDSAEGSALSTARSGKTSLDAFKLLLDRLGYESVDVGEDWIVWKPMDPVAAQSSRAPRGLLEEILEPAIERGALTLRQTADAAYRLGPDGNMAAIAMPLSMILSEESVRVLYSQFDTLRLLGSLSEAQWKSVESSAGLKVSAPQLSDEQLALFAGFTFDGQRWVNTAESGQTQDLSSLSYLDRTDFLPSGITPDCTLEVSSKSENVIFCEMDYGTSSYWSAMDENSITYYLAGALHPEAAVGGTLGSVRLAHLKEGVQRKVSIMLTRGDRYIGDEIDEPQPSSGEPLTPQQYIDSLPEAKRLRLMEQIESILKGMNARRDQAGAGDSAPGQKPPAFKQR